MHEALQKAMQHWNMVAPVIECPKSAEDYQQLLANLQDAIELVGNKPSSPLNGLIEAMAKAAKEYENTYMLEQQGSPINALRYLIRLHGIKQSELHEVGSQGVVSEILNGKRSLTLRHVRALAKRFKVSPAVFISLDNEQPEKR